jgi:hypothetical protein
LTKICRANEICCEVTMGPSIIDCFAPVNGTCPLGCAACVCSASATPIATPQGDRPIAELREGDPIYSVHRGALAAVPIRRVHREPVSGPHRMVELRLAHGVVLYISPRHPTADGRTFGDLVPGDLLDGVPVVGASLVPYRESFTYDLLPDSDTGTYFAGGVLIASTLTGPPRARTTGMGALCARTSGPPRDRPISREAGAGRRD